MVGIGKVESEHGFFTALESALICGSMWRKMSHYISPPTVFFCLEPNEMTADKFSDVMSPWQRDKHLCIWWIWVLYWVVLQRFLGSVQSLPNKRTKTSQAGGSVSSFCAFLHHVHDFWAGAGLSLLCSEAEKSIWPASTRLGSITQKILSPRAAAIEILDCLHLFQAAECFK